MSNKQYKCEKCDFKAKSQGGLKSHQRSKHGMGTGRGVKFDLSIQNQAQANELIEHMEILIATSGWTMLKQIMSGNVAVLEEAIIDKKDPETGARLTEDELDDARRKRNIMKEMIDKPEQLIAKFKKQAEVKEPTFDPYAIDVRQFNPDSTYGSPKASTLKT